LSDAPPRPPTRIGSKPGATRTAKRIGGDAAAGTPPAPAVPPASPVPSAITVRPDASADAKRGPPVVTGIAGQRRQRIALTADAARDAIAAAGVDMPAQPLVDRAIDLFQGLVWSVGQPVRLAEEADQLGQAAQQRLYRLCDAVLSLQQSRHAGDLGRHLGRIHELLAAVAERMAGEGVRNAVLDWMGSEVLPASTLAELRTLQQEVSRLQPPLDGEIAALARIEAECGEVGAEVAAWGLACHFTSRVAGDEAQPAFSRVAHARLESLLRSQALALQQRHIVGQLAEHLRALRGRAHDAVLTDLPAWLGAVVAVQSRANPTQRYTLRTQLQAMTDRLAA
jgi:hypothetical protein